VHCDCFGNILVFLVLAAFPVDECPTISVEDDEEEVMCSRIFKSRYSLITGK
jgi:hypothetical protein